MALERVSIEKNDFPVGRRGYDPAAVDAHLRTVADEVEDLTRSTRPRTGSISATASEQVRTIIEAAEKSAGEIQQRVEEEARQIRAEARRDARKERAQATSDAEQEREQATAQAREYVSGVSDTTSQMLTHLEAMDSEISVLTESLREGSTKLKGELESLQSQLTDLSRAAQGSAPEVAPDEHEEADELEHVGEPEEHEEHEEPELAVAPEPETGEDAETATLDSEDDAEGARLIALNMALNGTPRDETERYLAENFELADRGTLLDEVYASVEA